MLLSLPLFALAGRPAPAANAKDTRPNILWITIEDWGPMLSCYGAKGIDTPNLDRLASEGIRFRAQGVYLETCTTPTVDACVKANGSQYDFQRYGWPAWYPTRTLEEWQKARDLWKPYVFRRPDEKVARPQISHSKKKPRGKAKKKK